MARTAFATAGRAEALRFLEYYLWHARLPTELAATAVALARFHPHEDEAPYLVTSSARSSKVGSATRVVFRHPASICWVACRDWTMNTRALA